MELTLKQQEKAAKEFAKKWENIGDEKQDTQRFWMELLQNVWKKMGKALVVITHDSRIARMADRQFQIVDGLLAEVTAK